MTNGMDFYRLKFEFLGEDAEGKLVSKKEESLCVAANYTDAECIAMEIMKDMKTFDEKVKYEIVKTKIVDLLLTDTFAIELNSISGLVEYYFTEEEEETALFNVTALYIETADDGKKKTSKGDIYVAAESPTQAIEYVSKFLAKNEVGRDWIIRNVKFDKASSVLVTSEMHKSDLYIKENAGL